MLKIKECYTGYACQLAVEVSENAFKITLPNVNCGAETASRKNALSEKEQRILEFIPARKPTSGAENDMAAGLSQR